VDDHWLTGDNIAYRSYAFRSKKRSILAITLNYRKNELEYSVHLSSPLHLKSSTAFSRAQLSTYLVRANRIGLWRFPRQNDAVWSDLPDDVQTDRVFRSNQAQVFTVVALKQNRFLFQIGREVITSHGV